MALKGESKYLIFWGLQREKNGEGQKKRKKKKRKKRKEPKRYGFLRFLVWILHGKQGSYGFVWNSREFYEFQTKGLVRN